MNDVPTLEITDEHESIVRLLRELQRAALLHPEAARALFRSIAAEGRLFAQTRDGARWKERLGKSALIERALIAWQTATLWVSEDTSDGGTPSAIIDALAAAASSPDRDLLLDQLFRGLDEVRDAR